MCQGHGSTCSYRWVGAKLHLGDVEGLRWQINVSVGFIICAHTCATQYITSGGVADCAIFKLGDAVDISNSNWGVVLWGDVDGIGVRGSIKATHAVLYAKREVGVVKAIGVGYWGKYQIAYLCNRN